MTEDLTNQDLETIKGLLRVRSEAEVVKFEEEAKAAKALTEKLKWESKLLDVTLQNQLIELEELRASRSLHREYYFNDIVTGESVRIAIDRISQWARRDPGKPITVVFNSPGGSVTDGLALYDFLMKLRRRGHYITTVGTGIAASMGAVLLQAGDERVMDANSIMLVHEVSFASVGKMSELEDAAAMGQMLQNKILDILSERSSLTARQIVNKWKRKDWWVTADEALKLGFVDRVE